MSKIKIDIDEYLSYEDRQQIVRDAFEREAAQRSAEDMERILTNTAYHIVFDAVDAAMDGQAKRMVREKTIKAINDLSTFHVFREGDRRFGHAESIGYKEMNKAAEKAQPLIQERVNHLCSTFDVSDVEDRVTDALQSMLHDALARHDRRKGE